MSSFSLRCFWVWAVSLIGWAALFSPGLAAQQPADVILHNGKILTVDKNFSIAQAIAIRGNRLAAVGTNEQILAMRGPNSKALDLKGRTVIPGIIDSHEHVYAGSESNYGGELDYRDFMLYPVNWAAVRTTEDVLNQIRGIMAKYQFRPGEWIHFASTGEPTPSSVKIMTEGLTRWDLDKVTPNNPVIVVMNWPAINGLVANTNAIDIIWGEHEDFVKKYGRFWIDSSGRPDGHIEAPATWFFLEKLPKPRPEVLAPLYTKWSQELNAQGVTAVSTWMVPYAIDVYKLLEARGQALIRIGYGLERYFMPQSAELGSTLEGMKDAANLIGTGSDMMWVDGVSSGAMDGSGTRACTSKPRIAPYSVLDDYWPVGQCLQDVEYRGSTKGAPITGNYFREWLLAVAREGVRMANNHQAGDRSVTMTLNLLEEEQRRREPNWKPGNGRGWGFDHCFTVNPTDLPRAAKLGVRFSCNLYSESWASIAKTFGDEVANTFPAPLKSMLKAGVVGTLEAPSFGNIELLITRTVGGRVYGPQERLTREEALRAVTIMAAQYFLNEDKLGTLEVGKLADLAVLDRDYLTIPENQIRNIVVQMTMLDGKIVFAHTQLAREFNLSGPGMTVSTLQELQARRKPGMSRR